MNNEEAAEESKPDPAQYVRKTKWDVICPRCGRFFATETECDHCGARLINPLVIAHDCLDNVQFGKMVNFFFKAIGAWIVAMLAYVVVIGVIVLLFGVAAHSQENPPTFKGHVIGESLQQGNQGYSKT